MGNISSIALVVTLSAHFARLSWRQQFQKRGRGLLRQDWQEDTKAGVECTFSLIWNEFFSENSSQFKLGRFKKISIRGEVVLRTML